MDDWPADDPRRARVQLRKELIELGYNDRAIARAVSAGALERARFGSYVDGESWRACDNVGQHAIRARAVVERARSEVVISHVSALVQWDVPLFDQQLDEVHVTRCDMRAGRREAGVQQHLGELRAGDIVARNGLRVTSPTRTALDCAVLLDTEHATAVVGDLLHRGLTTKEELQLGATFMDRWPGSLRQKLIIDLADGRCESVGEHRLLHLCWSQCLPLPIPQWPVRDENGRTIYYADFAWPELKTWAEFDGDVKYRAFLKPGQDVTDAVLQEKRRERRIEDLTGWRCIRITWADLYRAVQTAAAIRRMFVPSATSAS